MAKFLINTGARVNTEDNAKRVALEYALRARQDQIAVELIRAGADVKRYVTLHLKDGEIVKNGSMLALGMMNGTHEAVKEILKQDKRFFGSRHYDNWTVLDMAVLHRFNDLTDSFIKERYMATTHSLVEAFNARNFALFKRLVYYINIAGYSREWALRILVQSSDPQVLDYIKVLVEYIEQKEPQRLGTFMNFCPDGQGYPPVDIAARKEVREYLHDHWGRSCAEDFPALPFENSLPTDLCSHHKETRYSSVWYQ